MGKTLEPDTNGHIVTATVGKGITVNGWMQRGKWVKRMGLSLATEFLAPTKGLGKQASEAPSACAPARVNRVSLPVLP